MSTQTKNQNGSVSQNPREEIKEALALVTYLRSHEENNQYGPSLELVNAQSILLALVGSEGRAE